jgi:hypothetical protein
LVNLTPQLLYPRKEPWYLLKGMLGMLQSRFGGFGGEKNLFTLPGFNPQTV